MGGSFETSDEQSHPNLKPLRVASGRDSIFSEARDMVSDLDGWEIKEADEAGLLLTCERKGSLLSGASVVEIRIEGPDGIPSSIVHVKSTSIKGLISRDKANVMEFMKPFHRRVC